jgi:hypothetical protein
LHSILTGQGVFFAKLDPLRPHCFKPVNVDWVVAREAHKKTFRDGGTRQKGPRAANARNIAAPVL